MMKGEKAVVGVYSYLEDVLAAITVAKKTDLSYQVYTPTYVPEITHAVDHTRSKVAIISLTGGLIGITFGFTLAIMCGLDWPLRVSAKEIISVPGYVVVGYECTILFGALFTLFGGILMLCRMPNPFRKVGYDPRFSDDKFGVAIGCDVDQVDEIKVQLEGAGADEVIIKEGI